MLTASEFRFGGMRGQHYEPQRSVNFTNWTTISSFDAPLYPFLEQPGGEASRERQVGLLSAR